jgi:peptidoglycan/LPS O-acetylase OafA/YrhL
MAEPSRDMSHVRARRREARLRRRAARLDVGVGLFGAIVLIIVTPGLAVAAIFALLALALCALSVVLERRKRSRVRASPRSRRPGRSAGGRETSDRVAPRAEDARGRRRSPR